MRKGELAALAFEIRSFMGIGTKLIAEDLERRLTDYCPGMKVQEFYLLSTLMHNPSTIRELSDRMMLAPSTLVPIVDKLESGGMVVRGKDPDDRRRTPLELTEQARNLLSNVPYKHTRDNLSDALQALGLEKARELSKLLQAMVGQLDKDHTVVDHILSVSPHVAEHAFRCERGAGRGADMPHPPHHPIKPA